MTDVDGRPSVSAPPPRRVPRRKRVVDDWRNDPWDDTADLSAVQLDRSRRGSVIGRVVGFSFLVVLAVMILVAGAAGYWVLRQVNPPGDAGAKVNFTIIQGDTIETLALRLEQQGIVTNAKVFKMKSLRLAAGESVGLQKKLSLAEMTTRKHHAGTHVVEALINGKAVPLGSFELVAR